MDESHRTARDAATQSQYSFSWLQVANVKYGHVLQGIMTILRDRTTSREDFIFFSDRLATLLVERAMQELPFRSKSVVTPVDALYHGQELATNVRTPNLSSP